MEKVFVCAPILGHDINERKAYFDNIAHKVAQNSFVPVNPLRNPAVLKMTQKGLMAEAIRSLLTSDMILLCEGWESSTDCQRLSSVALWSGINVLPITAVDL